MTFEEEMSQIKFNDKVVIITGAGSGLGRCYALEFAKRGAKVVVNDPGSALDGSDTNRSVADRVVAEIRSAGGIAVANYDSVDSMAGANHIVATALDNFQTLDVLVNNAGILRDKTLLKLSEADWDAVIAVHLKGAFAVTQAAFGVMKARHYGRIVNTTSGAALYGNFGQSNYAAAKMALVGLMNSVSIEGAKYNIKCNCIAPVAASRMTADLMPEEMLERFDPATVAPMVLYLCSEQNQESKMIFNCAAGWFSRTEILCSDGVRIGDGSGAISPEDILKNWEKITAIENAKPLNNLMDTFSYVS